nr:SMI1/KNR4 family protein [Paenibacillus methanolicus]
MALQFGCCDRYYPCYECHLEAADHPPKPWPRSRTKEDWRIGSSGFVRSLTLSPISDIIRTWTFLQEEFDPDELEAEEIDHEIKPCLWNSKWIPIASNGGGDYLCIDTDPSDAGVVGQVFY